MTLTLEEILIKVGSFILVFVGAIIITKLLRRWITKSEASDKESDH